MAFGIPGAAALSVAVATTPVRPDDVRAVRTSVPDQKWSFRPSKWVGKEAFS